MEQILSITAALIKEEAQLWGIQVETFDDLHLLKLTFRGKTFYTRGSRTSLQSSVGYTISQNKGLTKQVLLKDHLPTPKGMVIKSEKEFIQIEKVLKFPLVLKPLDGHQGKGVVVGIGNMVELKEYFKKLKQHHSKAIIEEQVTGSMNDFRVVCINGHMVAAARRLPAHVVGDGQQTVAQLIEQKNQDPRRGKGHLKPLSIIEIDDLVHKLLEEQNMQLGLVPDKDQLVWLRKTANLSTGGESWDVTETVCPENKAIFERAAMSADLNTVGIDVMALNLSEPLPKTGGVIIELNASPGLRMHHFPVQGNPVNVAKHLLEMLFGSLS